MTVYLARGFTEDGDGEEVPDRILTTVREKIENFWDDAKPLTGPLQGCFRVTYGDWRAVYEIFGEDALVYVIAHRSEVYDIAVRRHREHHEQSS